MKKICFVITAEFVVNSFLINHLKALSVNYEITVLVNTNNPNFLSELGVDAKVIPLRIARDISLVSDLICLIKLIKIFHQENFASVHSITPKAGLLGMLAAWVLSVPLRIHTFQGEVWITKTGFIRQLLIFIDKLVSKLATNLIIVSPSERLFLVCQKIIDDKKCVVFGHGSISGVNIAQFKPNQQLRVITRHRLNISDEVIVFLFLGRLTIDKGVLDLAKAWCELDNLDAHLLFVGPDEQNLQAELISIVGKDNQNVQFVGHTSTPETYMAATDVLCLPSYREGFGNVIIEAAAMGVPAIASRIYGVTDAVVENKTGLLHNPHDILELKNCITMMRDNAFRIKLGKQARRRAISYFDSKLLTQCWVAFYRDKLG
jgi:glycosyltransferase involved in cell wall biosynthesis